MGAIRFHLKLIGYQATHVSLALFFETKLASLVTHWIVITASLPCWLHCIPRYYLHLHLQVLKKNYIKTVDLFVCYTNSLIIYLLIYGKKRNG